MKWIKLFEDFKNNNTEGSLITQDDIIKCIKEGGVLYSTSVKNYPGNKEDNPIVPISIDDDNTIIVDIDGSEYYVELNKVIRIEY